MPVPDIGDNEVILFGVVGSTAYGLNGPDSDIDYLGAYVAPTTIFHGLHRPTFKDMTFGFKNPDTQIHEVGKLASLCLSGNPTVLELLWLPEYEKITPLGRGLVSIRDSFLSAKAVRNSYLGYATQQFKKLEDRGDGTFASDLKKKTSKHARHMMRLCYQGFLLYTTGQLKIKLENPESFIAFGDQVADGDIDAAKNMVSVYEDLFNSNRSVLPDRPDETAVEKWLQTVRALNFQKEAT
jgi:predicted nucleotidyltransferase